VLEGGRCLLDVGSVATGDTDVNTTGSVATGDTGVTITVSALSLGSSCVDGGRVVCCPWIAAVSTVGTGGNGVVGGIEVGVRVKP
jgi:hypothetical protein